MKFAIQYRNMHNAIHGLLIFEEEGKAEGVLEQLEVIERGEVEEEVQELKFGVEELVADLLNEAYAMIEEIDYRTLKNDEKDSYPINTNGHVHLEEDVIHIINYGQAVDIYGV